MPSQQRSLICIVGGNSVSAFLSWRLQATNACDVTLVWKSGFESVAQYGITFRSQRFGNERFKPRRVVRTSEEAAFAHGRGSFDYVLLCVKALPDVYDISSVIESVVTPQHTCILINTSNSLGVEAAVQARFPKNVVLSLVSNADITQLGPSEFEHQGSTELWVGPAQWNPDIPVSIQSDMADALAMTLGSGQVECKVSKNIQQQQFEHMMGPVAFHTTSVLFETPNHAELMSLPGVQDLISETLDEVVRIAEARGCKFPPDCKDKVIEEMVAPKDSNSIMYQDYAAKRPMEVETYLGAPIKIAQEAGVKVPRIETLYALLYHVNIANQKRPAPTPAPPAENPGPNPPPMQRMSSAPLARGPALAPPGGPPGGQMRPPPHGGMPRPTSRAPSMTGPPPPPNGMRRGPGGYPPHMANGMMAQRGPQRRPSVESNGLDEFSHLIVYDGGGDGYQDQYGEAPGSPSDLAFRERELMLKQKELALREREMSMRGGRPPGLGRPPPSQMGGFDDDDDGDDFFDAMPYRGPQVDPENVDMMSITSRRNRKHPGPPGLRPPPGMGGPPSMGRGNPFVRGGGRGNRSSAGRMLEELGAASATDSVMDNPLMGYSTDRYGGVDRKSLGRDSRAGSLTAARLDELQQGNYGGYPPMNRRASQSPGNPFGPVARPPPGRPSPPSHGFPPNGFPPNGFPPNGMPVNGRPSPPDMRQPTPRHPPGHGNAVATHEVEQRAGVSNLYPPKHGPQVRSLTGSASASAGSGDSGRSANIDSENSAYSSQSSLGQRAPIGVR